VGILHANNMRDVKSDGDAGFATLAGALGPGGALKFYYALIFLPYLFSLTLGSVWPPVFCALSIPLAVKLYQRAAKGDFSPLVPETARLVAVFGLLLSAGLYFA
jgi:1,4-dihydroxy-2-naphthoate octaprenyltransferase